MTVQGNIQPFPIGYTFKRRRSKDRVDIHTIIDHLFTYNSKNELVCFRYVTTHEFMGQTITDTDMSRTSIMRAIAA